MHYDGAGEHVNKLYLWLFLALPKFPPYYAHFIVKQKTCRYGLLRVAFSVKKTRVQARLK